MSRSSQFVRAQGSRSPNPIHVLVVDDSAVVREIMRSLLNRDPKVEVTTAADPLIAMNKMERSRPDVIVLDIEMPRMDGLSFLRKLMAEDPLPVIVCSGFAGAGTEMAMRALDLGAVEVIDKPAMRSGTLPHESGQQLIRAVHAAAKARVFPRGIVAASQREVLQESRDARRVRQPTGTCSSKIVALGASTGGPQALGELLIALPPSMGGLLIVQHMPRSFTAAFARRLDDSCSIEVKEAESGDLVCTGLALIAPGDQHMMLVRRGAEYMVSLNSGPRVSGHRPSVDVLFRSVAKAARSNAIGVLLTGMGQDGAFGLADMKKAGAMTIAQDEATCAVFGMPRTAIESGAADYVAPLGQISELLLGQLSDGRTLTPGKTPSSPPDDAPRLRSGRLSNAS